MSMKGTCEILGTLWSGLPYSKRKECKYMETMCEGFATRFESLNSINKT